MEEQEREKTAFAALLYRQPGVNPFQAALTLFPDTAIALRVSQTWPKDEFVLDEIARFAGADSTAENYIPTKEDLLKKIWSWIDGPTSGLVSFDEKIKAAKLFAEIGSMIQKPEPVKPQDSTVNHKVFMYRDFGDTETWEAKLLRQQQEMMNSGLREIAGDVIASN